MKNKQNTSRKKKNLLHTEDEICYEYFATFFKYFDLILMMYLSFRIVQNDMN